MQETLNVTALYAGILAVFYIALAVRVALGRRRARVDIFDGGDRELGRAIRQHGNFGEYVPFALLLLALIELNGGSAWLLHGLGVTLLGARLVYLDALKPAGGLSFACRVVGMTLTWLVIILAAAALLVQAFTR